MSSRVLASVVTAALVITALAAYFTYSAWRERRVDNVVEGMTRAEVRSIAGEPDSIEPAKGTEFMCSSSAGVEVWSYDLTGSNHALLVFDAQGRLICKSMYFIVV